MILLAIAEFLKDFPDKQCKIIGQDDYGSNEQWFFEINQQVEKQQRQLKLDPKSSNHALIGFEKDESSSYLSGFPHWQYIKVQPQKFKGNTINATDIRTLLSESRKQMLSADQEQQLNALLPEPVKQWIDANISILDECHSGPALKPDTAEPE